MNDTQIVDKRVEDYVAELSRALSGWDTEDRAAVLDDVREHATAILTEEPEADLTQRLGTPRAFADELTESAGIAAPRHPRRQTWRNRYRRAKASRLGVVLSRARVDFAPAWAALRGVAVMWIAIGLLGSGQAERPPLLLIIGGAAGWLTSERYQALVSRGTPWRLLGYAADLATAVVGIALLSAGLGGVAQGSAEAEPTPAIGGLTQNGTPVTGIQAFGPDGKPVPVALFDQDGTPLDTGTQLGTIALTCPPDLIAVAIPYLTGSGQPLTNAYPERGVCVNADNVVVGPATRSTAGTPVQTWSPDGLPAAGQTVLLDADGAYAGLVAGSAVTPTPTSPTPAASASPGQASVAPETTAVTP